ncbi:MAG: urease accessory UreF family protein [Candidatus Nitrosocaldus sp.]|nr:urease accessory protein [Candidatus Nitrosocaldus sp.]MDW8275876.1 urease accessory UreF family protein [Candidatus Nitrosocaldus sp.]
MSQRKVLRYMSTDTDVDAREKSSNDSSSISSKVRSSADGKSNDGMTCAMSVEDISMMQLADSFFPTGMYTTSNGLEMFFYNKRVKSAEHLKSLLAVFLKQQIGPADCVALGNAYQAAGESNLARLVEIDNMLFSMRLIKEIREASVRSGIQLIRCLNHIVSNRKADSSSSSSNNNYSILESYDDAVRSKKANGVYPVALAVACNVFSIPKPKAGLILLYSFSISVIGAALRLGMLNHFQGQMIVDDLKPLMVTVVKENIDKPLSSMWQFAPEIDIVQMMHERLATKMFIT